MRCLIWLTLIFQMLDLDDILVLGDMMVTSNQYLGHDRKVVAGELL